MKRWILLLAIISVAGLPVDGDAMTRAEYRGQIRATPILARPYRAGHFYGNTVRRRHHRQTVSRTVGGQR